MVTTLAKNEFKHPILEHRFYQYKTDHKRQRINETIINLLELFFKHGTIIWNKMNLALWMY